tara:strand:- start:351 stop:587 length:237 start_codon:yes stop_codon:yes gene_type:complete
VHGGESVEFKFGIILLVPLESGAGKIGLFEARFQTSQVFIFGNHYAACGQGNCPIPFFSCCLDNEKIKNRLIFKEIMF